MAWTLDISKTPRGRYDIVARKVKGDKTADHRVFRDAYEATEKHRVPEHPYMMEAV